VPTWKKILAQKEKKTGFSIKSREKKIMLKRKKCHTATIGALFQFDQTSKECCAALGAYTSASKKKKGELTVTLGERGGTKLGVGERREKGKRKVTVPTNILLIRNTTTERR